METSPAHRRRGLGSFVMRTLTQEAAARAAFAAACGVRFLHMDASDDSAPILRRPGFRAVTTTTPYVWPPPGPDA